MDLEGIFEDCNLNKSRDHLVHLARTSESAERYDDMCLIMQELVHKTGDAALSVEERNLLSVAFKNVVGARRASLRSLHSDGICGIEEKLAVEYRKQLQMELTEICNAILALLGTEGRSGLINSKESDEPQVFYLKMAADYYRYLAECVDDTDRKYANSAKDYYDKANTIAEDILLATHPIRLGLALNYSVCLYEIVKNPDEACKLAKKAFDEAIAKLDKLEEADYKDSTLIMQLLRDNLTLWTATEIEDDEN